MSFARKSGEKYSTKLMDTAAKTGNVANVVSKRVVQKTAAATGDLTGI